MDNRRSFQTRARAIDHLGRGQIADCPTAISELWKNAYDAYAKNVSLCIYSGNPVIAAVYDDGFGMTKSDFLDRWLVIGTESKIELEKTEENSRFGLPFRTRQGEKGIGRLSAAFLAPVSLVVSKKLNQPYSVALVDWRLFENPFIALSDIKLPVEEFSDSDHLFDLLPKMFSGIRENLTGELGPSDRRERIISSWERFRKLEESKGISPLTRDRITNSSGSSAVIEKHIKDWPVFTDSSKHGTAIFLLDVKRELSVWVDRTEGQDDEAVKVRERLRETLTAFTDPYDVKKSDFNYEVVINSNGKSEKILCQSDVFGIDDFHELEHFIEGKFDGAGMFIGTVQAFGKQRGEFRIVPSRVLSRKGSCYLGPFSFCIGTFEMDRKNSTLDETTHNLFIEQASNFSGLLIYRDNLRVMPYGRHDADFSAIEERRGRHAGREFWAYRRSFGRISFTHKENPNLRDKAGREGFVDNRAMREMKMLIIDVLKTSARRFFGTDSGIRKEELPKIQKSNLAARKSAEKAKKRRRRSFHKSLRDNGKAMSSALEGILAFSHEVTDNFNNFNPHTLTVALDHLEECRVTKESLRLPPLPAKLGDSENDYRIYRDSLNRYSGIFDSISKKLIDIVAFIGTEDEEASAKKWFQSNQSKLSNKVNRYLQELNSITNTLSQKWSSQADEDRSLYFVRAEPILEDLGKGIQLTRVLNVLDSIYQELDEDIEVKYEPLIRSLNQLHADIDLDGALSVSEYDLSFLKETVDNLHSLAQTGISIEIIGHELEVLDSEVVRNLRRLPQEVRDGEAYQLAFNAHRALADRLRFLAPLKIAGYRSRQNITGHHIATYMESFFKKQFAATRTSFIATTSFRGIIINDLHSRIYPVFINLINNALYWVNFAEDRKIVIDYVDDKVIIADSGKGIDPDDIPHLFDLFFTRRAKGRGVGLYLCRANLGSAHHKIRFAGPDDPRVLNGANFIIEFKGVRND